MSVSITKVPDAPIPVLGETMYVLTVNLELPVRELIEMPPNLYESLRAIPRGAKALTFWDEIDAAVRWIREHRKQ